MITVSWLKNRIPLAVARHKRRKQAKLDKLRFGKGFGFIWSKECRELDDKVTELYFKTYYGSYSNFRLMVWGRK